MTDSATASPTKALTHCPHCGSKLPDIPVSLCPYCASPLETAADRKRLESVNAARIERVTQHADFEAACEATPPESTTFHEGARRAWWSLPLIGLGVLFALTVVPPFGRGFDLGGFVLLVLGAASAGAGIHLGRTGRAMRKDAVALPLLRRAGLIVDRRSETEIRGWGGRTTYYFKVEFEEGIVGEFRFPGLGAQEDPYATNLPGVAYTRGTELLHFRHIRV